MLYNVAIKTQTNLYFFNGLSDSHVKKIVTAHNQNEPTVFIKGETIFLKGLLKFVIFDTSKLNYEATSDEVDNIVRKNWLVFNRNIKTIDAYKEIGNNVTDSFNIGDNKTSLKFDFVPYVNLTRMDELKQIDKTKFDLTKLIRLCEEINISHSQASHFATGALARAIIDHIPPIFGCKSFNEVANNYKANGTAKSFSDSMKSLNESMRKISDKLLHAHITNKEALPNDTQVDCKRDLDVLLEEIIRILK